MEENQPVRAKHSERIVLDRDLFGGGYVAAAVVAAVDGYAAVAGAVFDDDCGAAYVSVKRDTCSW